MSAAEEAREALERMKQGDASPEVFQALVDAAELVATLEVEYMFVSPQTGLYYVTRNQMLVETMLAARPDATLYSRLAPPYPKEN